MSDTLPLPLDLSPTRGVDEPVECLGMSFPSDAARREFFRERLRAKLQDPAFRAQEGFPAADDEQILALSDPPYYTACPNPFLEDWFEHHARSRDAASTGEYRREPFAVDVSEGKTDPIYTAHAYHTKVPYKAILPAILHYTEPGDVVLDG
ncbi:MAG: DNA methylase, partial [Gemmatimonadota bacterium]|nr:DNA methylase [Gemmatimonadota bacterium]